MVINDLDLDVVKIQATFNINYNNTVLLSTPNLLYIDIVALRKLIIINGLNIILFMATPNTDIINYIRTQFMVTPITYNNNINIGISNNVVDSINNIYGNSIMGNGYNIMMYVVQRIKNRVVNRQVIQSKQDKDKHLIVWASGWQPYWKYNNI